MCNPNGIISYPIAQHLQAVQFVNTTPLKKENLLKNHFMFPLATAGYNLSFSHGSPVPFPSFKGFCALGHDMCSGPCCLFQKVLSPDMGDESVREKVRLREINKAPQYASLCKTTSLTYPLGGPAMCKEAKNKEERLNSLGKSGPPLEEGEAVKKT